MNDALAGHLGIFLRADPIHGTSGNQETQITSKRLPVDDRGRQMTGAL
jgi:hypothetical protein